MSVNVAVVRLEGDDLAWLRDDARRAGYGAEGDRTEGWFFSDNPRAFEMGKAYAGVHYLLTGTDHGGTGPLAFIGNEACGEPVAYEFGYGPGRVFEPDAVAAIASEVESLSAGIVRGRLESDALSRFYPFSLRALDDDDKEWLLAALQGLMTFMRAAADDGAAVLVAAF